MKLAGLPTRASSIVILWLCGEASVPVSLLVSSHLLRSLTASEHRGFCLLLFRLWPSNDFYR